jgi:uncharacterized membrane protein
MKAYEYFAASVLALGLLACGDDKKDSGGDSEDDEDVGVSTGALCPDSSPPTYADDVKPIVDKYCTTCHATSVTGAARHDAPGDHNFETQAGLIEEAHHVDQAAAAGPDSTNTMMPPEGYPAPSVAERKILGEWLACESGT